MSTEFKVKTTFIGADMAKRIEIERMMEEINNHMGGVDILVNNAGIQVAFHAYLTK